MPIPKASSRAKIAANRSNALRSTGPRTAAGKKSSSKNALRHGLTRARDFTDPEVNRVAQLLSDIDVVPREIALSIAEAHVRLTKAVRAAEMLVTDALLVDSPIGWQEQQDTARISTLDRLVALSDYEKRAAATLLKELRRL